MNGLSMDELIVFAVLAVALALFVWGKWRYDVVALLALLVLAVAGIVPASDAYLGFGHPAVVTVAAVLILSKALQDSGVVDVVAKCYARIPSIPILRILSLSGITAFASAFMNNVGAVSLLMPVTIRVAKRDRQLPSRYLLPVAFASLLGGMVTLIGTPPNIIISNFRRDEAGVAFQMFDFALVGVGVALVGIAFMALFGRRLIPARRARLALGDTLHIEEYMTELRVPKDSRFVGSQVRDLEELAEEDVAIVGMLRRGEVYVAPSSSEVIDADDILIVEADADDLRSFVDSSGFVLVGSRDIRADVDKTLTSDEVLVVEAIVIPESSASGKSARELHLHATYDVNLLGISRRGTRLARRLGSIEFLPGDVLLLQGRTDSVQAALTRLELLPLAERELSIGQKRRPLFPVAVFGAAVLLSAFGVIPIQISFVAAAAVLLLTRFLTLQSLYRSIDWPVIVLLGAMIPVGEALQTTGGAERIAIFIADMSGSLPAWTALGIVLVTTMLLSVVINNAAAVVVMAPIGIAVATTLGMNSDPFLMAVAIGASSAFLTPIGHQSNTIVMGPGGYHFSDYFRLGFPLSLLIVAVAIPLILWAWPLGN